MSSNPVTVDENTVRSALAAVSQLSGKSLEIKRIESGITNINWMVSADNGAKRYFVKVPGQNTEMFIDRQSAYEATKLTAEAGYGPDIIYVAPDGSFEVHEFLEGFHSCTLTDMLDAEVRQNVARAYKALHGAGTVSKTQTGFEQLHERVGQAHEYGARIPRDIDHLLWQCGRAEEAINAAGIDLCLCFNDAYVTNYMIDAGKNVKIIDWEYATNNDAYWDFALFGAETFLEGTDQMREIIEIHDGAYTTQAEARITLYYGVALTTWGFWAALQAKFSGIAFDFAKYSELLHMRVRHHMASPRWEQALLSL